MKKNVIFTIGINGYDKLPTINAMQKYANFCDADFFILKNPTINYANFYFEKFFFINLLEKYERVLYLDADVLITPSAKNIFELYNDLDTFYAYNETDNTETMDRDPYVSPILPYVPYWPIDEKSKRTYFNAGIFLVSNKLKEHFVDYKNIPPIQNILSFGDQTYLNYLVFKNNINFVSLDYSFNRMHLGMKDESNERYKSNFIHYAGPDVYGNGNKTETIIKDYNSLYNE